MRFLGTGAADVIPCPLCNCPICTHARMDPRRARFRSMFLLDDENLIDCGPDFAAAGIRYSISFEKLKNIFITHTHEDHLDLSNAGFIRNSRTRNTLPINLYLSQAGYDYIQSLYLFTKDRYPSLEGVRGLEQGRVFLHPVLTGRTFSVNGYEILAVNTTHRVSPTETAINYRFSRNGHSLLYACDTGYYLPESLELLENSHLDCLIMEGTWGNRTDKSTATHMNAYSFLKQVEIFTAHSIVDSHTAIYISHINHNHDWTHDEYQNFMDDTASQKIIVAEDGLLVPSPML